MALSVATRRRNNRERHSFTNPMLCYAMLPNRSRSQDASALWPPRTSDRRSKMNARMPQEIQHERQEAPAGPKLSARRLQEASQNELTQKPPRAVGSCREPPGAAGSCRKPSGASQESGQEPAGAVRSHQGDLGAVRSSPRSRRELSGAARERSELSGAARSRRELSEAVRSQPGERSGAGGSRQEPPG